MGTEVAALGCTFKYETTPSGSVTLVATAVPPVGKTTSGGKGLYKDKITIAVVSGTVVLDSTPTATPPASSNTGMVPPGTITINGTSQKNTTEGDKYVLKGDEGSETFECTFPSETQPYVTTVMVTIKATVDDPGQNVVKVTQHKT